MEKCGRYIMLQNILKHIHDLPCITYEEYFTRYVMYVQDHNIDEELKFVLNHNFLNSGSINRLVNDCVDMLEELV